MLNNIYLVRYMATKLKINQSFDTQSFIMGRKTALTFANNFIYFSESAVNLPYSLLCSIFPSSKWNLMQRSNRHWQDACTLCISVNKELEDIP